MQHKTTILIAFSASNSVPHAMGTDLVAFQPMMIIITQEKWVYKKRIDHAGLKGMSFAGLTRLAAYVSFVLGLPCTCGSKCQSGQSL